MHPYQVLIVMGGLMSLLTIMCTNLVASLNAQVSSKGWTLAQAVFIGGLFSGMFGFMASILPEPIHGYAYMFGGGLFVAAMLPLPVILHFGKKRAVNEYTHAFTVSQWALQSFDRLVEPGKDYISEESLHRLLRNDETSDKDRRAASSLVQHFDQIGHQVGEERLYRVWVETKTTEHPYTNEIKGISREDLQTWPGKVAERKASWMPASSSPQVP